MNPFRSPTRRWWLLALFWGLMIVLGIGGFQQQARDGGFERSTLETIYLTIQLVTLEYGGEGSLNWRLEIARFVAPAVAAGTILQTLSVVFRDQFTRFRMRFLRGHTVVLGLGQAGSRLIAALAGAGRQVVAVERDPAADGLSAARELDIPVLIGDATDPLVLAPVNLGRASQVVVVCGSDATNVALTVAMRGVVRSRGRGPLRCAVHLTDAELCALLRGTDLRDDGGVRLDFFNVHERAAHTWVAEHELFGDGARPPHLVVLGLGQLGRSLIVTAAQRWCDQADGRLRVTMVDRVASGRWHALGLQHPALPLACEATTIDADLDAPTASAVDAFRTVIGDGSATSVAVTFEDESLALSSALLIHQTLPRQRADPIPVVVRTRADAGLGVLLEPSSPGGAPPFPGMALFPFLDRACTLDVVDGGLREQLARSIHEDYLSRATSPGAYRERWEDLRDDERESSRSAADGVIEGLDAIGCDLVPLRRWGAVSVALSDTEVDRLAELEHERWRAERTASGWRHGPKRDDVRKLNPLLVPWPELPPDAQAGNKESARALPGMLARAGFEPARRS